MVDFNTSMHSPLKVGSDNNSSLASGVEKLKKVSPEHIDSNHSGNTSVNIAAAFYGDGPYSIEHPNNTTEFVAQYVDYLA